MYYSLRNMDINTCVADAHVIQLFYMCNNLKYHTCRCGTIGHVDYLTVPTCVLVPV